MALVDRMRYYKVPGFSIALIDQEELAWVKGYGVMEAGGEKPVTPETIFQAASISKPIAGGNYDAGQQNEAARRPAWTTSRRCWRERPGPSAGWR